MWLFLQDAIFLLRLTCEFGVSLSVGGTVDGTVVSGGVLSLPSLHPPMQEGRTQAKAAAAVSRHGFSSLAHLTAPLDPVLFAVLAKESVTLSERARAGM